jgi:hypothetical protein
LSTFSPAEGSTLGTTVHPGAALAAVADASASVSSADASSRSFRLVPGTVASLLELLQHRSNGH